MSAITVYCRASLHIDTDLERSRAWIDRQRFIPTINDVSSAAPLEARDVGMAFAGNCRSRQLEGRYARLADAIDRHDQRL